MGQTRLASLRGRGRGGGSALVPEELLNRSQVRAGQPAAGVDFIQEVELALGFLPTLGRGRSADAPPGGGAVGVISLPVRFVFFGVFFGRLLTSGGGGGVVLATYSNMTTNKRSNGV